MSPQEMTTEKKFSSCWLPLNISTGELCFIFVYFRVSHVLVFSSQVWLWWPRSRRWWTQWKWWGRRQWSWWWWRLVCVCVSLNGFRKVKVWFPTDEGVEDEGEDEGGEGEDEVGDDEGEEEGDEDVGLDAIYKDNLEVAAYFCITVEHQL